MDNKGINGQEVKFALEPTPEPDAIDAGRPYVYNAARGIGMDVLERVVREHVPVVDHPQVVTKKKIIWTRRHEGYSSPTYIDALVEVDCTGTATTDWQIVRGLYHVSIKPDQTGCMVLVEKLVPMTVHRERLPYVNLPSKDYAGDPKAREVMDRNARALASAINIAGDRARVVSLGSTRDVDKINRLIEKTLRGNHKP